MSYTGASPAGAIVGSAQVQDGSLDYRDFSADAKSALLAGGMRNLLINPQFNVNQRAYAGGAVGAGNTYTYDRWRVVTSGQAAPLSGNTVTAPAGGIEQVVEGANIIGGSYCLSWVGTATAQVNGAAIANGGVATLTAGANATVRFSGGTVSLPQFERGSVPTVFDQRFVVAEILLCMRYFEALAVNGRNVYNQGVNSALMDVPFTAWKRGSPTLIYIGAMPTGENTNTPTAVVIDRNRLDGAQLLWTGSGGTAVGTCGRMLVGGTMQFNAEL